MLPVQKQEIKQKRKIAGTLEALRPFILNDDAFLAYTQLNDPDYYEIIKDEPKSFLVMYRAQYAKLCLARSGISSSMLSHEAQQYEANFLNQFHAFVMATRSSATPLPDSKI
jgi:hypothetical protein